MRIVVLSDFETFDSEAYLVELQDIPDDPYIEDIEEALREDRFKIIEHIF